jgi:DNA (cytosine-5)-methyltransferase 1
VDVVAGGVPCQPFSRAGRSKIRSLVAEGRRPSVDPRAGLWKAFTDIVAGLRPRAVLLENVPDLAVWDEGAVLASILGSLEEVGFRTDAKLMNAFDHGVPQHRTRLIIVGTQRGATFDWPAAAARFTVRDAIDDLPPIPPAHREPRMAYPGPRSWLQERLRRDVPETDVPWVHDHISRDVRPDDAEAFSLLSQGQTFADLPARLQRYRADTFADKYKRLSWDGLSRSITAHIAKDGYWYIHPDQHRTLSIREAARIQTFPDWFRFAGQPSLQYRQVGNAVPPLLAEAIGGALAAALAQSPTRRRTRGRAATFRGALLAWHAAEFPDGGETLKPRPWAVLAREVLRCDSADLQRLMEWAPSPADLIVRSGAPHRPGSPGGKARWTALVGIASAIVDRHAGEVPSDRVALRRLPGVGDAIARAVLVHGFGARGALTDSATSRVVRRLRGAAGDRPWQTVLDLHHLAGGTGPDGPFNMALRDLAASHCRADPACLTCPVRGHCRTFASSVERERSEPRLNLVATTVVVTARPPDASPETSAA